MLREIYISDFALMDKVHLSFYPGFNVITGETGAGKSNLIDAIGLLMGQRAKEDYIRNGKEETHIEAIFDISNNTVLKDFILNYGIEESDELVISRTISKKGKKSCRVNGHLVTTSILSDISLQLFEIHGQHEHQSLFSTSKHLELLDDFCGKGITSVKSKVLLRFKELKNLQKEILGLKKTIMEKHNRMDFLNFEINEIQEARLSDGEEEDLLKEKSFLSNISKISNLLSEISFNIDKDMGVDFLLNSIFSRLKDASSMDDRLEELYDRFQNIYYELEDIFREIRHYQENLEADPYRLDEIVNRLSIINKLKRKYGNSIFQILSYLDKINKELSVITNSDLYLKELEEKEQGLKNRLLQDMKLLSDKRKKGAAVLEKSINREFKDIGMEKVRFQVEFKHDDIPFEERMSEEGVDNIEFLFSANPGEPLKPLARIASGGELSRVMLALKSALARIRFLPILIFDEVDSGLGGEAAFRVGGKLSSLSSSYQIICVTHLPQIACLANTHFLIYKTDINNRAVSQIKELSIEERITEVSRMLEGETGSQTSRELAIKMLGLKKNL